MLLLSLKKKEYKAYLVLSLKLTQQYYEVNPDSLFLGPPLTPFCGQSRSVEKQRETFVKCSRNPTNLKITTKEHNLGEIETICQSIYLPVFLI